MPSCVDQSTFVRAGNIFSKNFTTHLVSKVFFPGTTTIEHDLEGPREVSKCRERGCFVQRIRYNIPMRQISALAALSENCEQHIRVRKCMNNTLHNFTSRMLHYQNVEHLRPRWSTFL